jgi:hypothetical protein
LLFDIGLFANLIQALPWLKALLVGLSRIAKPDLKKSGSDLSPVFVDKFVDLF